MDGGRTTESTTNTTPNNNRSPSFACTQEIISLTVLLHKNDFAHLAKEHWLLVVDHVVQGVDVAVAIIAHVVLRRFQERDVFFVDGGTTTTHIYLFITQQKY